MAGRKLDEIDWNTGAPKSVRTVVNSVESPADRLRILRQYYPDAEPMVGDPENFTFRNPKTGHITAYNPPGADLGDLASLVPDAGAMVGGGAGTFAGGLLGTAAGPVGTVGGAIAGAAVGGAGGRELVGQWARGLTGVKDPRSWGGMAREMGTEFVTSGLGEGLGRGVAVALPAVTGIGVDAVGRLIDARGVPASLGARTGIGWMRDMEAGLRGTPLGRALSRRLGEGGERADEILSTEARRLVRPGLQPGSMLPDDAVGRADILGRAIGRAAERFGQRVSQQTTGIATDAAAGNVVLHPRAVLALRDALQAELDAGPRQGRAALEAAIRRADQIIEDAADSVGTPLARSLSTRTELGKDLRLPVAGGTSISSEQPYLQRLYGALHDDIYRTAREADTAAGAQSRDLFGRLQRHDAEVTGGRNVAEGGTQSLLEQYAGERGTQSLAQRFDAKRMLAAPNETRALLEGLAANGEGDAANQLRASLLNEIGTAQASRQNAAGDVFSFNTYLTNYTKARDAGTLDIIFPRTGGTAQARRALDDLSLIAGRLRGEPGKEGASGTGNVGATLGLLGAGGVGGLISSAFSGGIGAREVGAAILAAATPWLTSRLLASPNVARILARTFDATAPNTLSGHLGRLATMEIRDAAAAQDRDDLMNALRETPLKSLIDAGTEREGQRSDRRSEAEPPPPLPEPGAVPPGLLQTGQAGPPPGAMPPGLLVSDPSAAAASAQFAQGQQGPPQGIPPGLLTGDPEQVLRGMMA